MAWHRHIEIEIAAIFRQLSRFRFWHERGERLARIVKTNYEGCAFLDTRPTDAKRARDSLRRWMRGAKVRGPLKVGKAERRRDLYARLKYADTVRYQAVLAQQRARADRYLKKRAWPT